MTRPSSPTESGAAGWRLTRAIIHLDLDAFFVAVERLENPALEGVPVIVGGRPEFRGVVSSASYEARRYGVRSAMPTSLALRLCPEAVLVTGSHGRYGEMSRRVMAILACYTPLLEQVSIDEAFLDVTGTEAHYGPPGDLAVAIQVRIDEELRLSCSLGVATNKLVAKVASDSRKPHGITVVAPGAAAAFLAPLPVRRLWGVGEVTAKRLALMGVETIGDLALQDRSLLQARFGSGGEALWRAARGEDDSPVVPEHDAKSISREETFAQDLRDPTVLHRELLRLVDAVGERLRRHGLVAKTVAIKLRYADFTTLTRQETLQERTDAGPVILETARRLFDATWDRTQAVRLVGVGVAGLGSPATQLRLFEREDDVRRRQLDEAVDRINARFGERAVRRASLMDEPDALWIGRQAED